MPGCRGRSDQELVAQTLGRESVLALAEHCVLLMLQPVRRALQPAWD
jgi:hypothetical protein